MKVFEVIQQRREQTGISVAELSRRTGVKYESLRTSLEGSRGITASELVFINRELDLKIEDFENIDPLFPEQEVA